ncbi:MAG TPA: thioredoxin [Sphingomonadales bacterium]|nr:thioredoxin [Sphingomonadales bacterium]
MNRPDSKLDGLAPPLVKQAGLATFVKDVIEPSHATPVLVDFWAEWCGPCKALTPVLEKVVREAKGAVLLAKVNIDENQELAAELGIQSIPTVIAFKGGRPVDAFAGALPESEVKKFIARLGGAPQKPESGDALEAAEAALAEGDAVRAAGIFSHVLAADAANLDALGGLARAHLKLGQAEEAKRILAMTPKGKESHPAIAAAFSQLAFAGKTADAGKLGRLINEIEKNPKSFQARYDLAEALFAAGDKAAAAEHLLYIVAHARAWNEDAARKLLVKMFEAAGPKDSFTLETRRKLSSLLYA